jgi:hypothetical protein
MIAAQGGLGVIRFSVLLGFAAFLPAQDQKPFRAQVPSMWDDAAMAHLELPLPQPEHTLRFTSSEYYYRIPVRPVYKTYPVYARDREPPGYLDRLRQESPASMFDAATLNTQQDWIRAGELVFDAPILMETPISVEDVRHPEFVKRTGVPVAPNGTIPALRYVVRKKGTVELGSFACGMCHTRVQADGTIIKGAQGNFPGDRVVAFTLRQLAAKDPDTALKTARQVARSLVQTPWAQPDPNESWFDAPLEEHLATRTDCAMITCPRAGGDTT